MFDVHKFNIGLVENLVHVDELLDVLRDRFSKYILYGLLRP
jgi:hypothetical protein